jgi:adrenodoxin-NADP+ reductase
VGDAVRKALRLPDAAESDDESPDGRVRAASAVVVGHGNVALDCARILAKGGAGLREGTDAAREAVQALGGGLERVAVVGRRGHVQAAFTIKEVRELVNLRRDGYGADFVVSDSELDLGSSSDASREELGASRPRQRIDKLLRDAASVVPHRQPDSSTTTDGSSKQVSLRFLLNPVRFESDDGDDDEGAAAGDGTATSRRLSRVVCERTRLVGDEAGKQRAEGTGELEILPADLAVVSVGYRGEPVPGLEPFFDAGRGTVRNDRGRVDGGSALGSGASAKGALYVTGWLKRGPTGIIGTNIADAKETVASVLSDLAAARLETATTATDSEGEPEVEVEARDEGDDRGTALESLLASRGVHYVDWEGYRKIVKQESQDRRSEGQPREKITSLQRLLEVARS